ncbi:MAG: hypothetical protein HUU26_13825 [Gemmatimonadaceae bacterium]|nr:hypothetical protein [Gemmatimonadaceae bacterium]
MTALYWFAMVVGVGMYLFSVFADTSGSHGDVDGHLHIDGDTHHALDTYKLLSLRNATYFLFAFGVTGVSLNWMWGGQRGLLTALLALFIGGVGASLSTVAFGWLRKSESGEMPGDRAWVGATAQVVLPLQAGGTGKIFVSRGGRSQELLAQPFDDGAANPELWLSVVILEIRDGVALVAPNDELSPETDAPRLGA